MSEKDELQSRVEAKRKRLEARAKELRADVGASAREEKGKIDQELTRLRAALEEGWENLTEGAAKKLNEWLRH